MPTRISPALKLEPSLLALGVAPGRSTGTWPRCNRDRPGTALVQAWSRSPALANMYR
jgi:hypothetical protein